MEKDFTIVHYDQRGSGKSYEFGEDYSTVTIFNDGCHVKVMEYTVSKLL